MTASTRTRRPLIARVSAVALAAGLLAGCAAGPVTAPADNPAKAVAAAVAVTQPAPAASPTTEQVALSGRTTTAAAAAAAPATRATSARRQVRKTIYIRSYLDRPGSQAAVDTGKLVLWASKPLWLAGHDYAGWQWLAFVRTGTKVVVTQGRAAGTYVVTGHKRLNRQGGAMPQVTPRSSCRPASGTRPVSPCSAAHSHQLARTAPPTWRGSSASSQHLHRSHAITISARVDVQDMSTATAASRITLVESPACHFCHDAREALEEIAREHPFDLEVLDVRSVEGSGLMQAHGAAMSPLVLLDGRFVSAGRLPRGKLRKLLAAREAVAS